MPLTTMRRWHRRSGGQPAGGVRGGVSGGPMEAFEVYDRIVKNNYIVTACDVSVQRFVLDVTVRPIFDNGMASLDVIQTTFIWECWDRTDPHTHTHTGNTCVNIIFVLD
jgi:hypothetical protein